MNYRHTVLTALALTTTFSFVGCDKEDDDDTAANRLELVKTITSDDGTVTTYAFDGQKRVTSANYDGDIQTVTYSGNQASYTYFDEEAQQNVTIPMTVDANGHVTSYMIDGETYTQTYNADGQLLTSNLGGEVITYGYTDGNLTSRVSSVSSTTYTFTYMTDKFETRYDGENSLFGHPSKNLLSQAKAFYPGGGFNTRTYSYEFDNKNRVVQETETYRDTDADGNEGTPFVYVSTYTYFD